MQYQTKTNLKPELSMTLIPPSPVTNKIILDIRAAVRNENSEELQAEIIVYLAAVQTKQELYRRKVTVPPHSATGINFNWPTAGHAGEHELILEVHCMDKSKYITRKLRIIASQTVSTEMIGGAYVGLYHWNEQEGCRWNSDIEKMTDEQWRELVRSMHTIGMNIILIQELFRNQQYAGRHNIKCDGYHGRAYYPSKLFPERMPIAAEDPIEAIFSEADKLGMQVCPGIGMYAWFDYSADSLAWHIKVAEEVWERYGHHPSFYAWKVAEEGPGDLTDNSQNPQSREELCRFFEKFTVYLKQLAPDKPVMMARNTYGIKGAEETYRKLLPNLDILMSFCFHRMELADNMTGEEAATILQALCDEAGSHLWMNMEIFLFENNIELNALIPRPIEEILHDLKRFPGFEKIVCYQYPGLMNNPNMSITPGGHETVKLYRDYQHYLSICSNSIANPIN